VTYPTLARVTFANIRAGLSAKVAEFCKDRRGSAAILFALSMPMLIGGLGLGFEVSNWYMKQRGMQNAADASVLAAATNGGSNYNVEAKAVAAQYGFTTGVTVVNNVACPGGGNTCYSATVSGSVPLYLSPVIGYGGSGGGQQNLSATAIAKVGPTNRKYCITALAGSGIEGIRTNGSPKADLAGCSVKSNTSATCQGDDLGALYGDAVGTSNGCGAQQNSGVSPSTDQYAGLKDNIPADPCGGSYPQYVKNGAPLTGGNILSGNLIQPLRTVCGDLQLSGDVTVNSTSGVLVIYNGRLDTNGHTLKTSSGSALTIVFSGSPAGSYQHTPTDTSPGHNGIIDIVAPSSGPWTGVAMYQDPSLTSGVDISAAGNSPTWDITGLVYLPHASVTLSGVINKASNGDSCFALVVDNITINGTGRFVSQNNCPPGWEPTGTVAGRGQLVY
jgi:hypothetical protein